MKIGITGQDGFIGYHLSQTIKYKFEEYEIVPFERPFLGNNKLLDSFVSYCDVIVHLAGVNRANSEEEVYTFKLFNIKIKHHGTFLINYKHVCYDHCHLLFHYYNIS